MINSISNTLLVGLNQSVQLAIRIIGYGPVGVDFVNCELADVLVDHYATRITKLTLLNSKYTSLQRVL